MLGLSPFLVLHLEFSFIEVNPFPAMWSSWFTGCEDYARCLVDSWDLTFQHTPFWNSSRMQFRALQTDSCGALWWLAFPVFFLRLKNFRRFSDIWINKVNSFHFSSTVELQFLLCQFLFFHDSERRYQFSSILPDHKSGFGRRVNFCHSRSGPHVSLWRFFLSIEWTLKNLVQESDKLLFESTFQ